MSAETIQFREADPQQIGAITLVLARANAQRDGEALPIDVGNEQIEDMQGRLGKNGPDAWTYVATDGKRVVGFAFGYPRTDESNAPDTEYLSLLMVEPEYWGQRIASRLLDLVTVRARGAGRSRLTLWTRDEDNSHARSVYEHKGYALTGRTRDSQYGRQVEYQLDL